MPTFTGAIDFVGDTDFFTSTLLAGVQYYIDLEGSPTGRGTLTDSFLTLRNSGGGLITSNDDSGVGLNSRIIYTPLVTATYQYETAAFGSATGSYTLHVEADDFRSEYSLDAIGSYGSIAANSSTTGTVNYAPSGSYPGDQDWFQTTLTAGHQYYIDLVGGTLSDTVVELRNSTGGLITSNDDGGAGLYSRIIYTAATTGTYYVVARGFGSNTGTYTVGVHEDDFRNEYSDAIGTYGTIPQPGSATGTVNYSGDQDWFQTTLTAGHQYYIDLVGGSLSDTVVALYNSSGTFITSDDDGGSGLNSRIIYTATTTGTYYVSARGFGSNTGTYTAYVREDDYRNEVSDAIGTYGTIVPTGSATGTINYNGDYDLFSVAVTAGTQYVFDLEGASTGQGSLSDPFLTLFNSAGTLITTNDDGGFGLNSRITYTAPSTTTLYVAASELGDNATGTYRLTATRIVTPTAGNDILYGTPGADTIDARAGNDQVFASDGNDSILGSAGNDTIYGGFGNDTLDGGSNNDNIHGESGNDYIFGRTENDSIYGEDGNDTVNAGSGDDRVDGGAGNDSLKGAGGADTILGDIGNDNIDGDGLNDSLSGGAGNDTIFGDQGVDTIDGGIGNDLLNGGDDEDSMLGGDGNDVLGGGTDNDTLNGGAGNDTLRGDQGRDSLLGAGDDDLLNGGEGLDTLDGGSGADTLIGGADRDFLTGGTGDDIFRFSNASESSSLLGTGSDTISDFTGIGVAGGDRIDVSGIDADITSGVSAFTFISVGAFSGAGQLRVASSGSDTLILGNIDADTSTVELRIVVQDGAITPNQWSALDFIL